ncbi:HAD family hydrolase [Paenibacillus sp.]|jgi:phosphoglycolate phosphatase-like HAD superfamily hydrolase|uniref:HAD family hydrolase n=1 Tax=Paenibacillus sp. TaxID=58172 RepID=UPI0028379539|nr:HAD family hydrolase [Paenibacillus sp.]MDR0266845.1 HAD hydrolase-like protein [Paenibacillus sp.]
MSLQSTLTKPKAIIFDMDGTLFQTESLLLPAYHKLFDTLRSEGLYMSPTPPEERILGSLGMLLEDIWKVVMPDGSQEAHNRANELLLQFELEGLAAGETLLYPEVKETLEALRKQGVKLYVASNGLEHYISGIVDTHELSELFDGLYSAGKNGTLSKVDLVKLLLDEGQVDYAWMVGDRSSDVEAGKKNELHVIGCAYAGFGNHDELKDADVLISSFSELLKLYEEAVPNT